MTTVDSATPVASSTYRRMLRRGGGIADISSTSMSASQFSLEDGTECGWTVVVLP